MVYDIYGSWSSTTGPNAAVNDTCAAPQNQQGSAVSAIHAWENAGFPRDKMVLGVPAYGRLFNVTPANAFDAQGKLQPYAIFNKNNTPAGDHWDSTAGDKDDCGNPTVVGGINHPWSQIQEGWITPSGSPAAGISYAFDCCSQTVCPSRPCWKK
jgi:chitinase